MYTKKLKNRNFSRVAATLLSIFAILAIGLPMSGSASAQAEPAQFHLDIRAYIDGYSQLVIQGSHVYWHHIGAAAPGRHNSSNEPTYLNGAVWYPTWPDDPNAENIDCNCDSSTFGDLTPVLPENHSFVLTVMEARNSVTISQQPFAGNDQTLIIDFDDGPPDGPAWYEVDVIVNYDLYILNTKTGLVERLTTLDNTGEFNPSWSPDGKKIVHDVAGGGLNDLYITDVNTHVSTPLPGAEGGNDAAWSPNGKWIVFDRRWNNDLNLYLLPPTGGTPQLVVSNAINGNWSPNSQRLVFERDGALWTASVRGGDEKKIVNAGYNPSWSPNGTWIAYDLDGDLWKVRLNTAGARSGYPIQLTSSPANEGGATWSQDSQKIAFSSDASGDADIWQMPAGVGPQVRLVRTSIYGDYDPAYSRNGQYIAYEGAGMPAQPYIAAFPRMDYIEGQDWPADDTVHLVVNDPKTKLFPDYAADLPTVATSWNPETFWVQFYFSYDLKAGDRITQTDGYLTRNYTVQTLDVTGVSKQADSVTGIAEPGAKVYVWAWGHDESYLELKAKKDGTWRADFNTVGFALMEGMWGRAELRDKIGNRTIVEWSVPNPTFNVFPAWNYVQGWDWLEGATVSASVEGKPECAGSGLSSKLAGDSRTSFELYFPPACSVAPGDNVVVTDGVTTRSMIVQTLGITTVDAAANTVSGVADDGAVVQVSIYIPGFPTLYVTAAGGAWLADFNTIGADFVSGDCGPTRILDAAGNATGMDWCAP